jgi:hypothetical protein
MSNTNESIPIGTISVQNLKDGKIQSAEKIPELKVLFEKVLKEWLEKETVNNPVRPLLSVNSFVDDYLGIFIKAYTSGDESSQWGPFINALRRYNFVSQAIRGGQYKQIIEDSMIQSIGVESIVIPLSEDISDIEIDFALEKFNEFIREVTPPGKNPRALFLALEKRLFPRSQVSNWTPGDKREKVEITRPERQKNVKKKRHMPEKPKSTSPHVTDTNKKLKEINKKILAEKKKLNVSLLPGDHHLVSQFRAAIAAKHSFRAQ